MIKLNTSVSGADFAHGAGETVEFDRDFEKRLVKSGQAEYVKKDKKAAGKKDK